MKKTSILDLMVSPQSNLLEVLRVIDLGASQIALVANEDDKILGIATDGDIRRALLSGASLDARLDGHYQKDFKSVFPECSRESALDLMIANQIDHLPIVDSGGKLYGLHLFSELVVSNEKPNWAVIMVGGRGKRLGALTQSVPKPMIKVAGRPILERIVLQLVSSGIRRIYLAVNYLSHLIKDHFGDGSDFGCRIEYLQEDEAMGSGGALSLLPDKPTSPLLVMNGDLVTDFSVEGLLETHKNKNAVITVGVRKYKHEVPFGCIETADDLIISLLEKPVLEELINTGIYSISPEIIGRVPCEFYPITDLIAGAIENKENIACYHIDEWIDVGIPDQLAQARGHFS